MATRPDLIPGWPLGMNNTLADVELPKNTLRDAVNVDIRPNGNVASRAGIVPAILSAGAHSIYSAAGKMVWATATQLYASYDGVNKVLLEGSNANYAANISYVEVNGEVYFVSPLLTGKININGTKEGWGTQAPTVAPTLSTPLSVPAHNASVYQVTCTFVLASGEESGAPLGNLVMCGDVPYINVTAIPQSSDARVKYTRIYATAPDGDEFFRVLDVPAGTTTAVINSYPSGGMSLTTQFNNAPPTGQLVEYHNGRLYVASGNVLWESDALRYGIFDNVHGFTMYPSRITMIKAVTDGMYLSIAGDRTYFLQGMGTDDVVQIPVSRYAAIEGAACNLPESKEVAWFANGVGGVTIGAAGGETRVVTGDNLAVPQYQYGSMTYLPISGNKRMIGVFGSGTPNPLQHPDFTAGNLRRLANLT